MIDGGIVLDAVPRALVVLLVIVGLVDPVAALRSDCPSLCHQLEQAGGLSQWVTWAERRVASYAFAGFFAAWWARARREHRRWSAGAWAVPAAERRGNRARGREPRGRPRGAAGPIIGIFILGLIRADLLFLGVEPAFSTVVQGVIMVAVVMLGAFVTLRRRTASRPASPPRDRSLMEVATLGCAIGRCLLFGLLAIVVVLQIGSRASWRRTWVSSTLRFAIPLAIIAACQTPTMLTGGIDLSVAVVASMSAYVMATTVSDVGWLGASLVALPAAVVGLVNRIGVESSASTR